MDDLTPQEASEQVKGGKNQVVEEKIRGMKDNDLYLLITTLIKTVNDHEQRLAILEKK